MQQSARLKLGLCLAVIPLIALVSHILGLAGVYRPILTPILVSVEIIAMIMLMIFGRSAGLRTLSYIGAGLMILSFLAEIGGTYANNYIWENFEYYEVSSYNTAFTILWNTLAVWNILCISMIVFGSQASVLIKLTYPIYLILAWITNFLIYYVIGELGWGYNQIYYSTPTIIYALAAITLTLVWMLRRDNKA